jgi:hypothetical protein
MEPLVTNYLYEHICVDYMSLNDRQFGLLVDRHGLACGHHGHHRV